MKIDSDFGATAQHMALVSNRIATLQNAMEDSTAQFCVETAREWRRGALTYTDLKNRYAHVKQCMQKNYSPLWLDAGLPSPNVLRTRAAAELPACGYWFGPHPLGSNGLYPKGNLVYVLFDEFGAACYVGSTKQLSIRLGTHKKDGKKFVRWQAWPAEDRNLAYEMENRFLQSYKPYLNLKAWA